MLQLHFWFTACSSGRLSNCWRERSIRIY